MGRAQRAGSEAESKKYAAIALESFRAAKARALKLVAGEQKTKREVMLSLGRLYQRLCEQYLRASPATTYQGWLDHGPKREWDELVAALGDDAIWDRLVDTYQERDHV